MGGIPATGPLKEEVYDVVGVPKNNGAGGVPATGPLNGQVYSGPFASSARFLDLGAPPESFVFNTFWPLRLQVQILGSGCRSRKRRFLIQIPLRFNSFWPLHLQGQTLGSGCASPKRSFLIEISLRFDTFWPQLLALAPGAVYI